MNILSLTVKNFRSFEGLEKNRIILRKGINVIVGENDVGKSSLLRALQITGGQIGHERKDIFKLEGRRELVIELELEFNKEEMEGFLSYITGNSNYLNDLKNYDRFVKDLGSIIFLKFSHRHGLLAETHVLRFQKSTAYLIKDSSARTGISIDLDSFFEKYFSDKKLTISQTLRERTDYPARNQLKLEGEVATFIQNKLKNKLKVLSEIRKRPYGPNKRVLESLDGGEVASVLFTLKNGTKKDSKKFNKIQKEFTSLFPNLSLDVRWSDNNMPLIFIEKIPLDRQVPIENVGAGIGEMIILLTLLTEAKGLLVGLDLPEMQFHPHAQRLLLKVLEKHSVNNQIIVVTHSPTLLNPKKLYNIIIIREQNGRSFSSQLPNNHFTNKEKAKLERLLLNNTGDFFFSRATLIVEGPTETGAMPIFSGALDVDFDMLGISLLKMEGNYFGLWDKLLSGFEIPHATMCDKDALLHIDGHINCGNNKVKTSSVFCSLMKANHLSNEDKKKLSEVQSKIINGDNETYPESLFEELKAIVEKYNVYVLPSNFEGVLIDNGFGEVLREASSISRSKAIQGRFVAERILAESNRVPSEFVKVINAVKKLATP